MVFIVKVPGINGLGKTKGCEGAGNAILKALKDVWTSEEGKEVDSSKIDLEEIHLALGMAYKENGGGNDSGVHWDIVKDMKKAKIVLDGKVVQENGRWRIKGVKL